MKKSALPKSPIKRSNNTNNNNNIHNDNTSITTGTTSPVVGIVSSRKISNSNNTKEQQLQSPTQQQLQLQLLQLQLQSTYVKSKSKSKSTIDSSLFSSSASFSSTSSSAVQQMTETVQPKQQQQQQVQPTISIIKTLHELMMIPSNRSCADCKSTLLDTTQVYISLSPIIDQQYQNHTLTPNSSWEMEHTNKNSNTNKYLVQSTRKSQSMIHNTTTTIYSNSPNTSNSRTKMGMTTGIPNFHNTHQKFSPSKILTQTNNSDNQKQHTNTNNNNNSNNNITTTSTSNRRLSVHVQEIPTTRGLVRDDISLRRIVIPASDSSSKKKQSNNSRLGYMNHNYTTSSSTNNNNSSNSDIDPPIDPALIVSNYIGNGKYGHGVFVCTLCGAAHKLLGSSITIVNAVQDTSAWNTTNIQQLVLSGTNLYASTVLERYMYTNTNSTTTTNNTISNTSSTGLVQVDRPTITTSIADRLIFVRAKYQTLSYILPPPIGPLSSYAWDTIVQYNYPNKWGTDGWATSIAYAFVSSNNNNNNNNNTTLSAGTPVLSNSNVTIDNDTNNNRLQKINEDNSSLAVGTIPNTNRVGSTIGKVTSSGDINQSSTSNDGTTTTTTTIDRLVDSFSVITASQCFDPRFMDQYATKSNTTNNHMNNNNKHHQQSLLVTPNDVYLQPIVIDTYPIPDTTTNTTTSTNTTTGVTSTIPLPDHLSLFVFPNGCKPSTIHVSPTLYSIVLTNGAGERLYGTILHFYDTVYDISWLLDVFHKHNNTATNNDVGLEIPSWGTTINNSAVGSRVSSPVQPPIIDNDVIFLPKCLVLLSRYPFFDIFRKFLLQLYKISLTESPLPIERYITNFVTEIPLPPPGIVQIQFSFTNIDHTATTNSTKNSILNSPCKTTTKANSSRIFTIERPPENQLPMCNFSYLPLFGLLSVQNILLIIGCLLQETRIVLVSKYYSILVPVSEGLLSLLFPFHWQGMYIPVIPYSMLDILDAPVPYLVGIHSMYLKDVPVSHRPCGVVIVDIDTDTVHLGTRDDDTSAPRYPPIYPEKYIHKLRIRLNTITSCVYIPTNSMKTATITTGIEQTPFSNTDRVGSFAYLHIDTVTTTSNHTQSSLNNGTTTLNKSIFHDVRRREILEYTDKAYSDNEMSIPISGFLSEQGNITTTNTTATSTAKNNMNNPTMKRQNKGPSQERSATTLFPLLHRNSKITNTSNHHQNRTRSSDDILSDNDSHDDTHIWHLLDTTQPPGFDVNEIRNAFFAFFVSLFQKYKSYIDGDKFRAADFLVQGIHHDPSGNALKFVESIIATQMFEAFLEDRRCCPDDPEVLLFDESIKAKQNRSLKKALTNISMGRTMKQSTEFLDDTNHMVTTTYTPPTPSNWGLPDDGRTYSYNAFPKLDPTLFGKVRKPHMNWSMPRSLQRSKTLVSRSLLINKNKQNDLVRKALLFPMTVTHKTAKKVRKVGINTVESAIKALSLGFADPKVRWPADDPGSGSKRFDSDGNSSVISDVTLSSTFEMSLDIMSNAEEVVINARRKQAILLGIIIQFQSYCRRRLVLWSMNRFITDKPQHLLPSSDQLVIARQRAKSSKLIQSYVRKSQIRFQFIRIRMAIILIQAQFRCQRVHLGYIILRGIIERCQALIRGRITRIVLARMLENRMKVYREQIFLLWMYTYTPLSYRTQFWITINKSRLLYHAIAECELKRLWHEMKMTTPPRHNDVGTTEKLNICNGCYHKAIRESIAPDDSSVSSRSTSLKISLRKKPAFSNRVGNSRVSVTNMNTLNSTNNSDRVIAERIQIYERLSSKCYSDQTLENYLIRFAILSNNGLRKVALSECLWTKLYQADACVELMVVLFPELLTSNDISFVQPSTKGLRRFQCENPIPSVLNNSTMCIRTIKNERIQHNLFIIADISIRIIPTIIVRLSLSDNKNSTKSHTGSRRWVATNYGRKLNAIQIVHSLRTTQHAQYLCIQNLLDDTYHHIPYVPSYSRDLIEQYYRIRHRFQRIESNDNDNETQLSLQTSMLLKMMSGKTNDNSSGISNMATKSGVCNNISSYTTAASNSDSFMY